MNAPSVGGNVKLGTFASEEEAGILYARARNKYPALENGSWQTKPCPLDLSGVPLNLHPIPSDRPGSASRFKGVYKKGGGNQKRSVPALEKAPTREPDSSDEEQDRLIALGQRGM